MSLSLNIDEIKYRQEKFDELKTQMLSNVSPRKGKVIEVTLPDGTKIPATSYETTPLDIAKHISQGLANACIVAKVNDSLWGMGRPLEVSCSLKLLKWDDKEAQEVYWHSSSHILGESLEDNYSVLLCNGPPIDSGGFYYDSYVTKVKALGEEDCEKLEKRCLQIIAEKQPFERIVIDKEDALELFKYNKFKIENIKDKVKDGEKVTVFRCGNLIDPCTGPHLLHTGKIKSFKVTKNSSAYWRADEKKESLQRVYGISFPQKKMLKDYLRRLEELKKRSHKFIGKNQSLWFMHPYAPGMVFFCPKGAEIYNKLVKFMRIEQRKRGFIEVHTPNMFHSDLFKKSGHWENYSDNMFKLKVDDADHALKPMNCPGHCVVYNFQTRSKNELPLRISEYGVLHRNEKRGTLTGMTRVRRFVQDDAHIFCRHDQIGSEMLNCLNFMDFIYNTFNFQYKLFLSTRPEKAMGEVEVWNKAEEQLKKSLDEFGKKYEIDEGGGAFYGPKIDIGIEDSLGRTHQCATIQLDFNLPDRFNLKYSSEKGDERPVMIHRAIFGSLERFLSILCEHSAGKWPFWMSPRQIVVIPLSEKFEAYAHEINKIFFKEGYSSEVDASNNSFKKKVRNAQLRQFNYILIVGQREVDNRSANVRMRNSKKPIGERSLKSLLSFFERLSKEKPFVDPKKIEKVSFSLPKKEEKKVEEKVEKKEEKEEVKEVKDEEEDEVRLEGEEEEAAWSEYCSIL